MDLQSILREVQQVRASDLYLITGSVPCMNCDGVFIAPSTANNRRITPQLVQDFAQQMMTEDQWFELLETRELNIAYMTPTGERFRINAFWQRGSLGIVMRRVEMKIPALRQLGLPPILRNIALADRGIVLVTGATGSGKSTTMASMLNYRNNMRSGHIVTIEDPIEFVYSHKRSIVTQRELGMDTLSLHEGLRNVLRQAPQVISIGEMRDAETVQFALHAAETGHLVFGTLHSTSAIMTLERVLHFFTAEMERQARIQMAMNLKAIICQRLVPKIGGGRVCACEILINTPHMHTLISKNDLPKIREYMYSENVDRMQPFDRSLYHLFKRGLVTQENAIQSSESDSELEMKFRGMGITPGSSWEKYEDPWEEIPDDLAIPEGMEKFSTFQLTEEEKYSNEGVPLVHMDANAMPRFRYSSQLSQPRRQRVTRRRDPREIENQQRIPRTASVPSNSEFESDDVEEYTDMETGVVDRYKDYIDQGLDSRFDGTFEDGEYDDEYEYEDEYDDEYEDEEPAPPPPPVKQAAPPPVKQTPPPAPPKSVNPIDSIIDELDDLD